MDALQHSQPTLSLPVPPVPMLPVLPPPQGQGQEGRTMGQLSPRPLEQLPEQPQERSVWTPQEAERRVISSAAVVKSGAPQPRELVLSDILNSSFHFGPLHPMRVVRRA